METPLATRPGEVERVDRGVVAHAPEVLPVPVRIAAHVLQAVVPLDAGVEPKWYKVSA